ncbi:MAG: methionyl-tRNA formyltransferase [bacterium]
MPNIIFMGTPEFAVPTLVELHEVFGIKAVVTVPDKPQGRGKKVMPSDVKIKATELGIPVLQPEKLKDDSFINELKSFEPDIMVVLAFRILPEEVFTISKIATFNIHASLLPKYRGAAPINWAIINGEKTTGLTSFILEKKVDTGNILLQKAMDIPEGATAGDLHDLMMPKAAQMAVDTCNLLISSDYQLMVQDNSLATPAPKIFPEFCKINWNQHAENVRNFIHGLSPFQGAWTLWNGERLKILRVEFSACGKGIPGTFSINDNIMNVQCDKGIISLREIQLPGKRPMKIQDFLRGYRGRKEGILE